ncbi:MAG: hypothetical protein JW717_02500 [Marinilabiliaceae bacterium]|nr:hypothetical protein [Marinilabiliaceae bacterium]
MKIEINDNSLNELKIKLKHKFPLLTNEDLTITNNDLQLMLRIVAYKLRKSKDEMNEIIEKI